MTKKNEIGYDLLNLIETAKEYVPDMSLVHAETFLSIHSFENSFEEIVEQLIDSDTAIPRQLFESINGIGIYREMKRNIWASLESQTDE